MILAFIAGIAVANPLGYLFHRFLHSELAGPLHRAHMQHHLELYPSTDLVSDAYRQPPFLSRGTVLFVPAFVTLSVVSTAIAWFLGLSLSFVLAFSVGVIAFGALNDAVHDSFHVEKCWLQHLSPYVRLREEHFDHHRNMDINFGIVSRFMDTICKTRGAKYD